MLTVISRCVSRYIAPCWPLYRTVLTVISRCRSAKIDPKCAFKLLLVGSKWPYRTQMRYLTAEMSPVISRFVSRYIALCWPKYRALLTEISRSVDRNIALQVVYYQWLRVTVVILVKKSEGVTLWARRKLPPVPRHCENPAQNRGISQISPAGHGFIQ